MSNPFEGFIVMRGQTVKFYRRTTIGVMAEGRENLSLKLFTESITPNNFGWDEPTKTLYYKDSKKELYKVSFDKVEGLSHE
jgi:sugar lactone lactonase YvrE